jgi:hypothetical protein
MKQKSNINSEILKYAAIFTVIYTFLPVIFFDLVSDNTALFYIFFLPYIIWYGMNFQDSGNILYLYYAVFTVIFWLIIFAIIKLTVLCWREGQRSSGQNKKTNR